MGQERETPMGKLPISVAETVCASTGCKQAIVVAWDGAEMHVVTFGVDAVNSHHAALGGNFVKNALGFPEATCHDESPKVLVLVEALEALEETSKWFEGWCPPAARNGAAAKTVRARIAGALALARGVDDGGPQR